MRLTVEKAGIYALAILCGLPLAKRNEFNIGRPLWPSPLYKRYPVKLESVFCFHSRPFISLSTSPIFISSVNIEPGI